MQPLDMREALALEMGQPEPEHAGQGGAEETQVSTWCTRYLAFSTWQNFEKVSSGTWWTKYLHLGSSHCKGSAVP